MSVVHTMTAPRMRDGTPVRRSEAPTEMSEWLNGSTTLSVWPAVRSRVGRERPLPTVALEARIYLSRASCTARRAVEAYNRSSYHAQGPGRPVRPTRSHHD